MNPIRGNTDVEYELAVQRGNARRLLTLKKHKVKPPKRLILFALIRKHPEILELLQECGSNPNDADGFNETALGYAINCCSVEIVEKLLKMGADPNMESTHLLPLIHASSDDKIEYVRVLLDNGADPNKFQWNGLPPLIPAIRDGEIQVARLLLEGGANPMLKGPDGKNAIQLARANKQIDLVKVLKAFLKSSQKDTGT